MIIPDKRYLIQADEVNVYTLHLFEVLVMFFFLLNENLHLCSFQRALRPGLPEECRREEEVG